MSVSCPSPCPYPGFIGRNWWRTRHIWKITYLRNIDRTRKNNGIRWRLSGM